MQQFLRKISKGAALACAGLVALYALLVLAAYHWDYSNGDRAGSVQKFANKGWICKTWEGEMAMVSLPGSCFGDTAYFVTAVRVVEAGVP